MEPRLLLSAVDYWQQEPVVQSPPGSGNDNFGENVAIDGQWAVVGADYDDDLAVTPGAAYVFRELAGWGEHQKLTLPPNTAPPQLDAQFAFGASVDVCGELLIVGAPHCDLPSGTSAGSAQIYRLKAGLWVSEKPAVPQGGDWAPGQYFGSSVAITANYALVGAPGDDQAAQNAGAAYIFGPHPSLTWSVHAKLTASDAGQDHAFGRSVDIDGDYAIVGAPQSNWAGTYSGAAYIFYRNQGGTDNWGQQAILHPSDPAAYDMFGSSVAIDGDFVIVGAPYNDDAGNSSGSAYIFQRTGGSWSQYDKLTAADAGAGDWFGSSVAIDGKYIVVGAEDDNHAGGASGSAYVFRRRFLAWKQQAKLTASDAAAADWFGCGVAVSGDYILVGSDHDRHASAASSTAYIFARTLRDRTEPFFSETQYLALYPDVKAAVTAGTIQSGLVHFLTHGMKEGRNPSVFFINAHYLAMYSDVQAAVTAGTYNSGFEHYVRLGASELRNPSAWFEEILYDLYYLDVAAAGLAGFIRCGFEHYMGWGAKEARHANLYFNEQLYAVLYGDVVAGVAAGTFVNGLHHFIRHGAREGRISTFNENEYLARNLDVALAVIAGTVPSGLEHFINLGKAEGRKVCPLYSEAYYLAMNPTVKADVQANKYRSGLAHFILHGQGMGLAATFDELWYLYLYPDVQAAVTSGQLKSGLDHFLNAGQAEGRNPATFYDETYYLTKNADVNSLVSAGWLDSGLEHYIGWGQFEGRQPRA